MKSTVHIFIVFGWMAAMACAQEPVDWKQQATKEGLDEAAISQLERDRILVTDKAYKQVFSAYLGGGTVFITSDSLLNAYHVLYEESFYHLENQNVSRLPIFLRSTIQRINWVSQDVSGNDELLANAKRRAKLVAGVALRLMDFTFRYPTLPDPTLNEIIEDEVEHILAAEGMRMPEWLGKPSDSFMGIGYSRYKPSGFYIRSDRLSRYFRAMEWIHSIPFRLDNDEELLSMVLLGKAAPTSDSSIALNDYRLFIGQKDNLDVYDVKFKSPNAINLNGSDLAFMRGKLMQLMSKNGQGRISDRTPSLYLLSAFQTPDAVSFQKTTDGETRMLPSGLDLAVALGSKYARELIPHVGDNDIPKLIDSWKELFPLPPSVSHETSNGSGERDENLYQLYLDALRALIESPPDAPPFMFTDAWKVKSLGTLLGSWAQLRHTLSLQAKSASSAPSNYNIRV